MKKGALRHPFSLRSSGVHTGNDHVHHQHQHAEHDGDDGGEAGQDLVPGVGLGFAEEGLGTAGNGAGKALVLAGLHQYGENKEQTRQKNGNTQYPFNSAWHSDTSKKVLIAAEIPQMIPYTRLLYHNILKIAREK